MKYLIVCKYCGRTLFKSKEPLVATLPIETQCPDCKKLLKLPGDALVKLEQGKKVGLEKT